METIAIDFLCTYLMCGKLLTNIFLTSLGDTNPRKFQRHVNFIQYARSREDRGKLANTIFNGFL